MKGKRPKTALALVAACLLLCGPARAATDQTAPSARDLAAAQAINDSYVDAFLKTYSQAAAARDKTAENPRRSPFYEIAASVEAEKELRQTVAGCQDRAAELKTVAALIQCRTDAAKSVLAEHPGELDLFDAFAATALRIGADVDSQKITRQQANDALIALDRIYIAAANLQAITYLATLGKTLQNDQPPYDNLALPAANAALKAARDACKESSKPNTVLAACLNAASKTFDEAIRIWDTTLSDTLAALLARGGADADAGKITREDLLQAFDAYHLLYGLAIRRRYGEYLPSHYVALFDRAVAKGSAKPASFDIAAQPTAKTALIAAIGKCDGRQGEFKNKSEWLNCYLAASKTYVDAIKPSDRTLFDAFTNIVAGLESDTDAGTIGQDEEVQSYSALATHLQTILQKQFDDDTALKSKAAVDDYVARFETIYAAAIAAHPIPGDGPLYDAEAVAKADEDRTKADAECDAHRADLKTRTAFVDCHIASHKAYTIAIKLRDTNLSAAYAEILKVLAVDIDAGRVPDAQANGISAALAKTYNDHFQKANADYQARLNKPLMDAYVARFEKLYADATLAHPMAEDRPAYDTDALGKAAEDRKKAAALCDAQRAQLKTMVAYTECYATADRAYAAEIKLRDTNLIDTYVTVSKMVAAEKDAGSLTDAQATAIFTALAKDYGQRSQKEDSDYQAQANKLVADGYVARFQASHAASLAAQPPAKNPPLDAAALPAAKAEANRAGALCDTRRAEFKTKSAYIECYLDREKIFAAAIKLQDANLLASYSAAMRAVAAEDDLGRFSSARANAIYAALGTAYFRIYQKQSDDYQAAINASLTSSYVKQFQDSYLDLRRTHAAISVAIPPFDRAADQQGVATRDHAQAECTTRQAALKTRAAWMECYLAADGDYLATIKIVDMDMFTAWAAAMRAAAADTDSGKVAPSQWQPVFRALLDAYNGMRQRARDNYQVALNAPLAQQYARQFDNNYLAATRGTKPDNVPPFDQSAGPAASAAQRQAMTSCAARQAEFKTHMAFAECRVAAQKALAIAIKLRDMILFEQFSEMERKAAADFDAGKINDSQWSSVTIALGDAYTAIISDQYNSWKRAQSAK